MTSEGSNLTHRVGRYEIVGHLATGGMAEILLGRLRGPSGFQRPVVIKRILPHLARMSTFVHMFLDEARIIAGIRHPNVVQVQELGQEGEILFMVMEYLEGESAISVTRRLISRKKHLDSSLCAYIVAQACAGLHAAHELTDADGVTQNLVHRDVSPQNIFITYTGQVKVIDFGIAQAADRITRTEAGKLKGKFEYMSPEQCLGETLDRRSDIFALGAVLYELSTGRHLFKRANRLLSLRAICEKPVPPPSRFVPNYPRDLEAICLQALARRRDDRYPTAAELRRDLMTVARRLGPTEVLEERLEALMQELFRDRIQEKAEMLRRVRSGSELTHVPEADTDSPVEVPVVPDDSEVSLAAGVDGTGYRVRPRRKLVFPIAVTVLLSIIGILGSALWVRGFSFGPPSPAASAVPEIPTSAPLPPSRPPQEVTITINTVPAGAEVHINGERRGETPLDVRLPRGEEPLPLEVRKKGFVDSLDKFTPDVDQRIRLTLVASVREPEQRTGTGSRKTAPATSKPGFYRFD